MQIQRTKYYSGIRTIHDYKQTLLIHFKMIDINRLQYKSKMSRYRKAIQKAELILS